MLFKKLTKSTQKGFTLLEILLVVAIIAILAGIVIIAINPSKNLGDSRNSERMEDVNTVLNAVHQYSIDNSALPAVGARSGAVAIGSSAVEICNSTAVACTGLVDLAVLNSTGKYLTAIPKDPNCPTGCNANGTGYTIYKNTTTGRLVVAALNPEQGKTISVTK